MKKFLITFFAILIPLSAGAQIFGDGNIYKLPSASGGSGTPGGSNTQVQYNGFGSFAGSSSFVYSSSTNTVSLATNADDLGQPDVDFPIFSYGGASNGNYHAVGHHFDVLIYPYRVINGSKYFGTTPASDRSGTDNGGGQPEHVTWAWAPVSGATGYRVFFLDLDYMVSNYTRYYDTTGINITLGGLPNIEDNTTVSGTPGAPITPALPIVVPGNLAIGTTTVPADPLTVVSTSLGNGFSVWNTSDGVGAEARVARIFRTLSGTSRISLFNGDGVDLYAESGDGYWQWPATSIVINGNSSGVTPLTVQPQYAGLLSTNLYSFLNNGATQGDFAIFNNGKIAMGIGRNGGSASTSPWAAVTVTGSSTDSTPSFAVANASNTPSLTAFNNGNVAIGASSSPNWKLSVVGSGSFDGFARASFFTATSTSVASTFPYASSTALSATTLCLIGDTCRTTWPTGGSSGGSTQWATTTNNSALKPNVGTNTGVVLGQAATTTNSLLEVNGTTTASIFIATSTTSSSIFPKASTTDLIASNSITSLSGNFGNSSCCSSATLKVANGVSGFGSSIQAAISGDSKPTSGAGAGGLFFGKTNGSIVGYGTYSSATVNSSADTGDETAGYFEASITHAGGKNAAVYATALNGTPSYSFYGSAGTIYNAGNIGVGSTTPGTSLSLGNTGANTINLIETATSTFGSGINIRTGCFAISGVCVGGTGVSGGTSGMLTSWTGATTLTATSAPTAAFYTATSTTASQLPYASSTATTVTGSAFFPTSSVFNATGLGVGGSPSKALTAYGAPSDYELFLTTTHGWQAGDSVGMTFGDTTGGSSLAVPYSTNALWTTYFGIAFRRGFNNHVVLTAATNGGDDVGLGGSINVSDLTGATMVVRDTGNVGIGVNLPTYPIDVSGKGHFTSLVDASNFVATSTTATSTFKGGVYVSQTSSSTAPYIYSKTSGFGGHIILEDEGGAGCTEITSKAGALNARVITCPSEI